VTRVIAPTSVSTVQMVWYVPILGTIVFSVPNVYPVTSDPTIVFLVLRDPPGGTSTCSVSQGTTLDTSMSISKMQTSDTTFSFNVHAEGGIENQQDMAASPLGVGPVAKAQESKVETVSDMTTTLAPSSSTTSSNSYTYTMTFNIEFSTSDDPFSAGHASDVIIGGGVDLFVTEALEVYLNRSTTLLQCLNVRNIYVWHPGKVTTYVLPVMLIEKTIGKLSTIRGNEAQNGDKNHVVSKLDKQIANWNTVLADYRSYNSGLTAVFSSELARMNNVVNKYHAFYKSMTGDDTAYTVLEIFKDIIAAASAIAFYLNPVGGAGYGLTTGVRTAAAIYMNYLGGLMNDCTYIASADQSPLLNSVCNDFDSDKWDSVISLLDGACTMPTLAGDEEFMQKYCQQGTVSDGDVEGGLSGDGEVSVLGFLKDSKKLLTFTAEAPVTLTWTSTVKSSRTFEVMSTYTYTTDSDMGLANKIMVLALGSSGNFKLSSVSSNSFATTRDTEQSHQSERTVTVNFGDADQGDYFAVRITDDPVYGTPVFTTMGGQSKCPGETGTSRRESGVRIVYIQPRCGQNRLRPCTPLTLGSQDFARFGVVIENLSPTGDVVYYTLGFLKRFEQYFKTSYQATGPGACGTPGDRDLLTATFQETDLQQIPFNLWVEVPVQVGPAGLGGPSWSGQFCNKFVDVALRIIASCEMPSPARVIYQYGIASDPATGELTVLYDAGSRYWALNSTATFSVEWPPNTAESTAHLYMAIKSADKQPVRRLEDGSDQAQLLQEMLVHFDATDEAVSGEEIANLRFVVGALVGVLVFGGVLCAVALRMKTPTSCAERVYA